VPEPPIALYSAAQVREIEQCAISQLGIPAAELMERAGLAAWQCFESRWPGAESVAVLCGGGNNGGDGYVFARHALAAGLRVHVTALVGIDTLHGVAAAAARRAAESGIVPEPPNVAGPADADVVVDALLGTGLDRDVSGPIADAIAAIAGKPVLSLDLPSGLHADSGRIMGTAVRADCTITFIGLKPGLYTGSGPDCCGVIIRSDLGLPGEVFAGMAPAALQLDYATLQNLLPPRPRSAHKGHCGHVLIVGGDHGFAGAALMAAEAAARVGSGLVSLATHAAHTGAIVASRPELMAHAVESPAELGPLLERATVVAVGPGLGQSSWSSGLLARVLESRLPLVLDADALNLLARDPSRSERWILTPHPGEAARLLETSAEVIQRDRFAAVTALRQRYDGVVVLKGAGTLVAVVDGPPGICTHGNPGMASGGMGDVLTGVIAGLLAQGLSRPDAAQLGVCLHGAAADAAATEGERGMLAGDLMPWLRRLANPGR
jgi:hydroxyethylthiazole kinase-like uncharacterized protein yjeF